MLLYRLALPRSVHFRNITIVFNERHSFSCNQYGKLALFRSTNRLYSIKGAQVQTLLTRKTMNKALIVYAYKYILRFTSFYLFNLLLPHQHLKQSLPYPLAHPCTPTTSSRSFPFHHGGNVHLTSHLSVLGESANITSMYLVSSIHNRYDRFVRSYKSCPRT